MRRRVITTVLLMLGAPGCASIASDDPLAPVPLHVSADEVATPVLRSAWEYRRLDEDGDPELPTHAAAIGPRNVFVPYARRIDALDLTGELAWSTALRAPLLFPPIPFRGGVLLASEEGWLSLEAAAPVSLAPLRAAPTDAVRTALGVVVTDDEGVYLLAAGADGELERPWYVDIPGSRRVVADADGERVYVVTDAGAIVAITTRTGGITWRNSAADAGPARPAIGRHVYYIDSTGRLFALDLDDGRRAWSGKFLGIRVVGGLLVIDDVVWVPGLDAALHGFTASGGSHLFRIPVNGRVHLDLVRWGPWILVSPQYGPWATVQGPRRRNGPADPGLPRVHTIESSDDLSLNPSSGVAGVVVIDNSATVRLLTPQEGAPAPETR